MSTKTNGSKISTFNLISQITKYITVHVKLCTYGWITTISTYFANQKLKFHESDTETRLPQYLFQ